MAWELAIVIIGRLFQIALGILRLRLLSTFLPTQELGYFYVMAAIASGLSLVFLNPVGMYAARKANEWRREAHLTTASIGLGYYSLGLLSFSLISAFTADHFNSFSQQNAGTLFAIAVALEVAVTGLGQLLIGILNIVGNRISLVLVSVATQVLGLTLSILFVSSVDANAPLWIIGSSLGNIAATFICFGLFYKIDNRPQLRFTCALNPSTIRQIATFGGPIIVATLLMWLQSQGYRLLTERWYGREWLAHISLGVGAAQGIFVASEAFALQFFYPHLYKTLDNLHTESGKARWKDLSGLIFGFYFLLFVSCMLLAPELVAILLPPKYQDLVPLFIGGLGIELTRVLFNVFYTSTHHDWRPQRSLPPLIATSAVTFCLLILQRHLQDESQIHTTIILVFGGIVGLLVSKWTIKMPVPAGTVIRHIGLIATMLSPMIFLQLEGAQAAFPHYARFILGGCWILISCYFTLYKDYCRVISVQAVPSV